MTAELPRPRKVFIRSYGCQMNAYDSERMADVLAPQGYSAASAPEEADLILLNTCHIREKASEKVYSELGKLRLIKEAAATAGREVVIGVAGCVAQAEGEEIRRRAPTVDLVVGPQSYQRLPELLAQLRSGHRAIATDFATAEKFTALSRARTSRLGGTGVSAFLTVQEGCDKFCTFCVVPYTRGAEVSRPVAEIVSEAERLAENGVRELALLGQNVNAWHGAGPGGDWGLAQLLARLAEIPGILRLRYTTSHPRDMDAALIAAHRDLPALMPHLHLPVQSGSDRILAAMNRRHGAADYRRLVERLRGARPDLALSGDFIVGFPGETEADFQATLSLVEEIRYASAFTFKYSPRPGTPAAGMDQVDEAEKTERLLRLQALIAAQQADFNRSRVGTTMDVLFEAPAKNPGQIVGRSPWLQPVHIDAPAAWIGTVRRVRIAEMHANSLFAAPPTPAMRQAAEAAA